MIPSQFAISSSVSTFFAPPEPFVSTLIGMLGCRRLSGVIQPPYKYEQYQLEQAVIARTLYPSLQELLPLLLGELLCFSCVNNRDEFFRSFCGFKLCGKIFMHQKLHKSCKNFKMNITVCCCGNHKEQLTGLTVGRVIIYTVWNCDSREGRELLQLRSWHGELQPPYLRHVVPSSSRLMIPSL